jgi:hypothetical protein
MYTKGKHFLLAAILLRKEGGYEYVVLHLCQGIETILKGLLLLRAYDKHMPRMKAYGHDLKALVAAVVAEFKMHRLRSDLTRELKGPSTLYKKHLLRYAFLHDIFGSDPATIATKSYDLMDDSIYIEEMDTDAYMRGPRAVNFAHDHSRLPVTRTRDARGQHFLPSFVSIGRQPADREDEVGALHESLQYATTLLQRPCPEDHGHAYGGRRRRCRPVASWARQRQTLQSRSKRDTRRSSNTASSPSSTRAALGSDATACARSGNRAV